MNLDLFYSFAYAVHPEDEAKRETLFENLKLGRLKDFGEKLMQEAVDHYVAHKSVPKLFCQDVQAVLPTNDRQNYKILCHVAGCEACDSKA